MAGFRSRVAIAKEKDSARELGFMGKRSWSAIRVQWVSLKKGILLDSHALANFKHLLAHDYPLKEEILPENWVAGREDRGWL